MNLFEEVLSDKDQSELEAVGQQPTQPASLVFSLEERKEWGALLKKAMKIEYPNDYKTRNYSDFYLFLLKKHYENTSH